MERAPSTPSLTLLRGHALPNRLVASRQVEEPAPLKGMTGAGACRLPLT